MKVRWLAIALLCACSSGNGKGTGRGSGSAPSDVACTEVRGKVEQLYRAEAQLKEPKRVEEAVADNTAMVMGDCAKQPGKIAPCVFAAVDVPAMEKCLGPLDDEGTDGEALRR